MTDSQLIEAALAGDEGAFAKLVGPHRRLLHAHCYRMLGSLQDVEDAVQETLLRAWRNLSSFQGRSSLRTWLYTIATNVCLRAIERRPSRVLPIDYGPPADPHEPIQAPLFESVWMDPYPDEQLGLHDSLGGPEARYEQRESIELAFIAALQLLPPRQRARNDVDSIVGMLTDTATLAMPPIPNWYRGREAIERVLREVVFIDPRSWRMLPTAANGQLALGAYELDSSGVYAPRGVTVLTLEGELLSEIVHFRTPSMVERFGLPLRA